LQAVRAMLASKRKRVDVMDKRDFVLVLRLVYSVKLKQTDGVCTMDEIREIVESKEKTPLLVPSDEVIDYAYAWFSWSCHYWASLQGMLYKSRPASVVNLVTPPDLPKV
jgi:hypothetical protein